MFGLSRKAESIFSANGIERLSADMLAPTAKEIHRAFDAESENVLAEAQKLLSDSAYQRAVKLKQLGFSWHPEANGPELEAKGECELYEHFADLYMKKYEKKFISSASVHRLAKKYGLILGEARKMQ